MLEQTKNIATESLKSLFPEEVVKRFLHTAIRQNKHIAIWSRPESQSFEISVDLSNELTQLESINLEELGSGFIVAPFSFPTNTSKYIQSDIYWDGFINELKEKSSTETSSKFMNQVINFSDSEIDLPIHTNTLETTACTKEEYIAKTEEAVNQITQDPILQKVVLSRTKTVDTDALSRIHNLFIDAIHAYPYSFNYIIFSPETGLWFGATPEILMSHDENNVFETMALAGTQPHNGASLKEASWTQKEIEEQALVSRYIINCFKKIRLREFEEYGPKTSMAGNLMHLRTDFVVDMNKVDFPELPNVMLELLHPTSAVCGMPKEWSQSFIKSNESHDRELYSGFLGPINFELGSSIYVNLRCCKVLKNKAILFAGAGITADSEPKKEYLETEMKFNTIQNLLH